VKKSKYIAIILATMLIFTSCGKAGEDKSQSKGDSSVITLQMRGTDSFNPLAVVHHSVRDAYSLCYDSLFVINNAIEPVGVLAQGIDISDDCMTAVVNLKDSVLWHDGIKLTANDVVYTINLLKENPAWEYYECVKYIDEATAIDALSLRLSLSRPYAQIAYSLTFPIVSANNNSLDTLIVGTGAYKFSKYTPAVSLELEKNDLWHGGEASSEKVNISIIKDNSAVTTAFNSGLLTAVTDESFDTENSSPRADAKTTTYQSGDFEYMAMNHKRGIFSSQSLRSAVSFAIDRFAIAENCYNKGALPVNAPIHPAAENIAESSILSQYSLANASEMLFLEGYTLDENTRLLRDGNNTPLSFNLLVNEENLSRIKTADLLSKQLFAAGIDVRVEKLPFDSYMERIRTGNFDAYLGGTRLRNFYDFEGLFSTGGVLNNYGYSSENMQTALLALSQARGQDSLGDAIFNFEEIFLREQPVCGLVFKSRVLITAENTDGKKTPHINSPYQNIANWIVK